MAVVDPNINVTPAYDAVNQALAQSAKLKLESGGDSGLEIANAIATPLAAQAQAQQAHNFQLQKDRQEKLFDLAKNSDQLDLPDGTSLDDVISGKVSPTLKPKMHIVTQSDIDAAVKSFGMDDAHKNAFDDMLGKSFSQKDLQNELVKKANFIHSSAKGNTEPADFEYTNPGGDVVEVKGLFDKDKKQYFMPNGDPAPDGIRPIDKNKDNRDNKNDQFDENKIQQLEKRLDPTQKRAGSLADAQKRLNGIQRLDALFKGYANDLTPQEWQEAATSWASVLGSGTGVNSREQIEALVPKSLRGNVKSEMQWFTNNPTGTDQQAFAARIQQGMAREQQVNTSIIKDSQLKGLSSVQDVAERKPERVRTMLDNYDLKPEDVIKAYPKLAPKLYPELGPFFNSEAEAHAALVSGKVKAGQKITINGRQAIIN